MRNQTSFFWVLLSLLLFWLGVRWLAVLSVDGLWFFSEGYGGVFRTSVIAQLGTAIGSGVVVGLVVAACGLWALRITRNRPVVLPGEWRGTPVGAALHGPEALPRLVRIAVALAVLIGAWTGAPMWDDLLAWSQAVSFDTVNPVLGHDVSFYLFALPVFDAVWSLAFTAVALGTLTSLGIYLVRRAIAPILPDPDGPPAPLRFRADPTARRHIALLLATEALLMGMRSHLDRYEVLYSRGPLFDGPSYTAIEWMMPLLTVSAVAWAVAAFFVFQGVDRMRTGSLALAVVLVGGTAVVRWFVPGAVQQFVVDPNEYALEEPHIRHHVAATREAWGLDHVEEAWLSGEAQLDWEDIQANEVTIDSVRLWDHAMLLETFRQVQEIRTYYEFSHVDNDRYVIDGRLRQTMLSPREMQVSSLADQAQTWVNQRLVYTHGYGVAVGPVNEVTEQGLPYLWVKDIPPTVLHEDPLGIDRPEIYFGEQRSPAVFVNTAADEFDFPTAEGNAYTTYDAEAGIQVGSFGRRLLTAVVLGDLNVLLSSELTDGSRVLLYRRVVDRVRKVAPFLWVDSDPTMVIVDGRLVWIVEGHTVGDRYPYAAHRAVRDAGQWVNYARNSVKVTVDAYSGAMTFYRLDEEDPLVATWAQVFPDLFTPASEMPAGVRDHLRYPIKLFDTQAELFATYHMTDPKVFYNREDAWEVPVASGRQMEPYFTIMKLPGGEREEFILMLPFTPRDKDNLAAWMVARSDGDAYGGLKVYNFPKDRLVYGPTQVTARTQQNDEISEKLTLWNQQSSQAPMGTLLVIPVEESLLYVQPLYLRADSDAIPELKRVIVGYEDQITMQPTLEEGLRVIFGGAEPGTTVGSAAEDGPVTEDWQELAARAEARYRQALEASQEGRWADFGTELEALGRALERLRDGGGGMTPSEDVDAAPEAPPAP